MTTPPSPPCDRCGYPIVEAHYPDGRCPRPPRRAARKAVAVTRAIGGVILLVVAVFVFLRVNGTREISLTTPRVVRSVQACALFNQWEASAGWNGTRNRSLPGDVNLLAQAVTEAFRSESSSQSTLSLQTDLTVLLHQVQMDHEPNSVTVSEEQSIQIDCRQVGYLFKGW